MTDGHNEMDDISKPGYGFFTRVTDTRLFEKIDNNARLRKYFTDRVTAGRVTVHLTDIALIISPKQELAFISHVRPTRTGTTGTRSFKASGPLRVDLSAEDIIFSAGEEHREEISRCFNEPSFRPNLATWKAIWLAIKQLRPDLAGQMRLIEQLRFDEAFEFKEDSNDEQIFSEKDAVGVALDIAGISFGGVFAGVSEARQQNKPLIEALCGNATEDVVINHDVRNFPEYVLQGDYLHACEFVQGGRRLTIFNVNRRPGERALGVDLIYHNESYNAFTFIQYKMLQREGSIQFPAWRYRPDQQFDDEAERMRVARATLRAVSPTCPDHFRFGDDPFFFKLCRRQNLKVNSGELARGAYLNLTHCDLILSSLPPRKARVLEPGKNVGRWLNRTQFTDLIARGWIGTINVTSEDLKEYVSAALESNRSVLVAVSESLKTTEDNDHEPDGHDW